ncbi:cupin domain-containing protein [Cupriavidus sp. 30B13]|uniref:cupin domain-containing protein n=1 Tax=Cupriavidus sp. 30B13 TaxID=3384241 RepID=UPI003B8F29E3
MIGAKRGAVFHDLRGLTANLWSKIALKQIGSRIDPENHAITRHDIALIYDKRFDSGCRRVEAFHRCDGTFLWIGYRNDEAGEMTVLLKWEPGAVLPFHKHPEIEQSYVLEGSFYDHDGICRAGQFVWRQPG